MKKRRGGELDKKEEEKELIKVSSFLILYWYCGKRLKYFRNLQKPNAF